MSTPRLGISTLVSGQSQKEITVNTAFQCLDAFVQTAVESVGLVSPPVGTEGKLSVVGAGATSAWVGQGNNLAFFIAGAWAFYAPFEGMRLWNKEAATPLVYQSGAWQNELSVQAKIGFFGTAPSVKTTVTFNNINGVIGGLSIGASYSQTELQALRDKCEELADDVRALKAALTTYGLV